MSRRPQKPIPKDLIAGKPEYDLNPSGVPLDSLSNRHVTFIQESNWEGPLPPPVHLKQFDEIVPGAASRILAEWEAETAHRRDIERKTFWATAAERIGGRILAFLSYIFALLAAAYCASLGLEWAAGIIGGATIASVVASFVYGHSASMKADAVSSNKGSVPKRGEPNRR